MNKTLFFKILKILPINFLFRPFYGGEGSILFMHKVVLKQNGRQRISLMKGNEIEVDFLEKMLRYLKEEYDVISLDEMCERLETKIKNKKKFIVITFDDGYKDNLTLAYPIFKKLNIPFTIYVTNCYPNNTGKLWWYMLEDILLENKTIKFVNNNKQLIYNANSQKDKDTTFEQIRKIIIESPESKRSKILDQLETQYSKNLLNYVKKESLSWDEIKTLSEDNLVTIGCHTQNHPALNKLSRVDQLKEILDSKNEIEEKINSSSVHFAYPFGTSNEINETEINIVKSSKRFKTATTTRLGNIFKAHKSNLYALPRIQVLGTQQNLSTLDLYICGLIPAIKNKLKRIITF
jgi:peptidoglycan/xylan/chitin deacetylase (PgdA/CDA1 family)